MKNVTKKKAFTLVELVIVIAVIGILAAVLVPTFSGLIKKARYAQDVALVRNINTTLAVDEIMTGSPNDAIELQAVIRSYGLSTETKSEGNYLFWDKAKNQVILAGLSATGIVLNNDPSQETVVALAEGESSKGTLLTANILAPEMFVDGYYFISTASSDGFAQAIHGIRNGENIDANLEIISDINSTIGTTMTAFANHTVFINADGNQVIREDVANSDITTMIISAKTETLTEATLNNVKNMNINVIDIPSNVIGIESGEVVVLLSDILEYGEGKINVSYISEQLIESILDVSDVDDTVKQKVKDLLLDSEDRKSKIKKVFIIDARTGNKIGDQEGVMSSETGTFTIGDIFNMLYDDNITDIATQKVYDFKGYYLDKNADVTTTEPTIAIGTLSYTLNQDEYQYIQQGDSNAGVLNIYAMYQEASAEVKYDNKYYTWDTVSYLLALGSSITSGNLIVVGKTGVIDVVKDKNGVDITDTNEKKIVIPAGVTLVVPYTGEKTDENNLGWLDDSVSKEKQIDYVKGDTNINAQLTVAEGVTLTNNGTITVGATVGAQGGNQSCFVCGTYGVLEVNGRLENAANSTIKAYGFITGSGTMTVNGKLLEPLTLEDWKGGTSADIVLDNSTESNLFDNWTMDRIRVETILYSKATYTAWTFVNVSIVVSKNVQTSIPFVLPEDCDDAAQGVFKPTTKESYLIRKYDSIDKGLNMTVCGEYEDRSLTVKISTYSINFTDRPFPIANMDITVASDGALNLTNNAYKILPGSDIVVEEGATLNIGHKFAVYEVWVPTFEDGTTANSDGHSVWTYPTDRAPATLKVKGTLNITENAIFSGYIQLFFEKDASGEYIYQGKAYINKDATLQTAFENGIGYKVNYKKKFAKYASVTRYTYIDVLNDEGNTVKNLISNREDYSDINTVNSIKYSTSSQTNYYQVKGNNNSYYYYLYDQTYSGTIKKNENNDATRTSVEYLACKTEITAE